VVSSMKAFAFESLQVAVSEGAKIPQQTQAIRVMLNFKTETCVAAQCDFSVGATFHLSSKLSCQHVNVWRYQDTSLGHKTRMGLTKLDRFLPIHITKFESSSSFRRKNQSTGTMTWTH